MNIKRITRTAAALAAGALALTLSACTGDAEAGGPQGAAVPEVLTLVHLPHETDTGNRDVREGMMEAMSAYLGMPVEEWYSSDYAAIVEALRLGHADVASFGPLTFVQAYERANAVPVGMRAPYGDRDLAFYTTDFVVRADSDIQSIEDFIGRTIAWVDPNSTSGFLVAANEIIMNFPDFDLSFDGLADGNDDAGNAFFSGAAFSGGHPNGIAAVVQGQFDIAPVASTNLAAQIADGRVNAEDIRIVHQSAPIPEGTFAARGTLDPDLVARIESFLTTFADEGFFEGVLGNPNLRLVPTDIATYQPVIDLYRNLNQ